MRKRILNRINNMMPGKLLRRQKFLERVNNKRRHRREYRQFSYSKAPKSSRFNRWSDYKRLSDRSF